MRHNDEIHWKDQAAFAALGGLIHSNARFEVTPEVTSYDKAVAARAYAIAEAMFAEREKNEHNPTEAK